MDDLAPEPAIADTNALAATPETEVTEETTSAADSAPAAPDTGAPERDKVQERIDKLTKEKYDARRDADLARYEAERLAERLKALETKPAQVVPAELPTEEQFDFDRDKYRAAMAAYVDAQAEAKVNAAFQQREQQQRAQEKIASFQKRQADFIASKPDYTEKVMRPPELGGPPITNEMADVIRESELGPNIAYYLAENVEKAAAIAQLSPLAQAREIGRIEARLEAAKAAPPPALSKAPPPPPSIGAVESATKAVPTTSPDSDALSDDEWFKAEKRRLQNIRNLKRNG